MASLARFYDGEEYKQKPLGDFARDGQQATVKLQVNRLVSWIWIGGAVLTLGALLAILPDRRAAA